MSGKFWYFNHILEGALVSPHTFSAVFHSTLKALLLHLRSNVLVMFNYWRICGLITVTPLYCGKPGEFKSYQVLSKEFSLPPSHAFHHHQLLSYFQTCHGTQTDPLQKSFNDVVLQKDNYFISSLYSQLITHQSDKYHLTPFQK